MRTVLGAVLSAAVWVVAATKGHALEMIWLPAVVIGAAWPRGPKAACLPRLRRTTRTAGAKSQSSGSPSK
jgi:hypothetical protein